ncbi:MAG TPA: deaminase [Candidatus Nanoarchaeia archaeon]|nr:deaminase [Candidatus Nanoarchaeia archaeon]
MNRKSPESEKLEKEIDHIKKTYNVKTIKENPLGKRPSWDESFMGQAIKNSRRSSCWFVSSGTVITQNNNIVATGYNGASPKRNYNCLEKGCSKENNGLKYEESLDSGECIGIHSEMNALGHLNKINSSKLDLYTTISPCPNCAKNLEPYGIERVFFKKPYIVKSKDLKEFEKSMKHFYDAGIKTYHFDLSLLRYWDIDSHRKWKKMDIWNSKEYEKARQIIKNWDK